MKRSIMAYFNKRSIDWTAIRYVIVSGSYLFRTENAHSDIDLRIVYRDGVPFPSHEQDEMWEWFAYDETTWYERLKKRDAIAYEMLYAPQEVVIYDKLGRYNIQQQYPIDQQFLYEYEKMIEQQFLPLTMESPKMASKTIQYYRLLVKAYETKQLLFHALQNEELRAIKEGFWSEEKIKKEVSRLQVILKTYRTDT